MIRVNKILKHPKFNEYLKMNIEAEKERIFCHHDLTHLMDVARIAYIMVLENNLDIDKEIVYAASLLHDIGRWKEYKDGTDHALASAELSVNILQDCGYNDKEIEEILSPIRNHRNKDMNGLNLNTIFYKSDKVSRMCLTCPAIKQCKRFLNGEKFQLEY